MKRFKLWLHFFLASFAKPIREEAAKDDSHEETQIGGWVITRSDRSAYKKAFWTEWSKPENIAERIRKHEEEAPKALELAKEASRKIREQCGLPLEDPMLPKSEELPTHMRNQPESTIRAMLRQENWEYDWELKKWKQKTLEPTTICHNRVCL